LIIEITETVALGDLRETVRFVEQLRELGCGVAIDDFGAGYTSFRNLRAMPVDVLKLDGTFCSNLAGNSDNRYFVRSLIDLARTFGIKTVAEWVETEEDAALLREWKVDLMQGNLFGEAQLAPPWPPTDEESHFQPSEAVPFVLPSEIAWDEEAADEGIDIVLHDADADEHPPMSEAAAFSFDAPEDESTLPPESALDLEDALDDSETARTWPEAEVPFAAEPERAAIETVEVFEEGLEAELSKLRRAIAALDSAFKRRTDTPDEFIESEPSFADLVSETALRAAI
jgi:EAL domain-containing protein (putative c-di-GMP-specific phosphodiesterase class I)